MTEARGARPIPVSVVVITKNEEANIDKCLASVAGFDQVFVVDSGSTDRTQQLAKERGAEVVPFLWNGRYPKKKQWCLDHLPFRHDWVLYVDADEEVYPELAEEIGRLMAAGPPHAGYFVRFHGSFLGRTLRHGMQNVKLILFDRTKTRFLDYDDLEATRMWEVEGHYQPQVRGSVGTLRGRALHADFKTLYHYFERHNRYSDWEAHVRLHGLTASAAESQMRHRRVLKALFRRAPFKGVVAFLYSYVVKAGFLDGAPGFHFAVSRLFYYWQTGLKMREMRGRR